MSIEKDFRILEEYVLPPKAPPQTDEYYKYVKPSLSQLDARLEYDMDEEVRETSVTFISMFICKYFKLFFHQFLFLLLYIFKLIKFNFYYLF